jgi:hypothetical protein
MKRLFLRNLGCYGALAGLVTVFNSPSILSRLHVNSSVEATLERVHKICLDIVEPPDRVNIFAPTNKAEECFNTYLPRHLNGFKSSGYGKWTTVTRDTIGNEARNSRKRIMGQSLPIPTVSEEVKARVNADMTQNGPPTYLSMVLPGYKVLQGIPRIGFVF